MQYTSSHQLRSSEDISSLAGSFEHCRTLLAGVEMGFFTAVERTGGGLASLAAALAADERAVDRLGNALTVLGLMEKTADGFANTELAQRYLVTDSPEYMASLEHQAGQFKRWAALDMAVRQGTRPGDETRTMKDWTTERFERFIGAMHYRASRTADDLAARFDLSGVKRLLDVGGGSGVYAMAMSRANPGLQADVFELPQVVPLVERYTAAAGMQDRVRGVAGDFLNDPLGEGYDFVFVSAIVHMLSPAQNAELLGRVWEALRPGGRTAVQDFIMNPDRTSPARGAFFALNMLVSTQAGDVYTEDEVRGWLEQCGFQALQRVDTGPATASIVGQKPM